MRTLWNMIAFLAVVNLLAIGLAIGWLGWTERLDQDRLDEVRELFRIPTAEAARLVSERAALDAQAAEEAIELERWGQMPFSTEGAIDAQEQYRELERLGQARLQRQAETLKREIDQQALQFDRLRAARSAALDAREARIATMEARSRDAEFVRLVGDVTASAIDAAIAGAEDFLSRDETLLVVDLLAAVEEERRQEILEGFIERGKTAMAGELLLQLRDRTAIDAVDPENPDAGDADSTRDSASNAPGGGFQA
ncbi:MAG: hypothetical protein GY825_11150 [Phycisphaeraceae bacterium]|nr:hypothetical protein [Phycisphaeraceae bacterium]